MDINEYDYAISRKEAQHEISEHNLSWTEFIEETGDRAAYNGTEVLIWMGY